MRTFCLAVMGSLALSSVLYSQKVGINPWDEERERELNHLKTGGSPSTNALSFEQTDDPTLAQHPIAYHEPLPAARKTAKKAEQLARKGHHEEAIAGFREALSIDPQYYEAGNNLALELEAAGQVAEAEKTFRGLMQSSPEHVLAFSNLATLLFQQHRYADAEAVTRQAIERHKFSFKTNYLLGSALVDQGHWTDEAKSSLDYAQVRYPEAKTLLEKWPAKAAAQ